MTSKAYKRCLTIAGSDSGGGAGIQADLKTFSALGCYGISAITALTAQNTLRVLRIEPTSPQMIRAQIDAVLDDIGVDAVKVGMVGDIEAIETVADRLRHWAPEPIVIDPVMIAKSGDSLLDPTAIEALRMHLIPLATVLTPNIPEAETLLNRRIQSREQVEGAAQDLLEMGPQAILLKGGHFEDDAVAADCLAYQEPRTLENLRLRKVSRNPHPKISWLENPRICTRNTHGTGCTLSSAIAAQLAHGLALEVAVRAAKRFLTDALIRGADRELGRGHGPVSWT